MKPGDIMIVYSLGAEANAQALLRLEGPLGPDARKPVQKRSNPSFDRGQPCGTDGTNPLAVLADNRSITEISRAPVRRPWPCDATYVCLKANGNGDRCSLSRGCGHCGRSDRGTRCGAFRTALASRLQTEARPATVRARGRVPRGGNNRSKAGITIEHATFTSPDEVCRPRVGYDANVNRDVTLR
jgi:hypothetical protein